jgi:DNA-binding GntR family transcriptional regulator
VAQVGAGAEKRVSMAKKATSGGRERQAGAAPEAKGRARGEAPARSRGFGVKTVYDALKHDILEMTLAPSEPLDETRLSRRFAMSRTPVREALVRLAAEGLVTTLPNRNTIVSAIDFSTVPVYFDSLALMYRVTTRLAAMRRTAADLADIRALQKDFARSVREADALAMVAVNRDFHVAIAKAGGCFGSTTRPSMTICRSSSSTSTMRSLPRSTGRTRKRPTGLRQSTRGRSFARSRTSSRAALAATSRSAIRRSCRRLR